MILYFIFVYLYIFIFIYDTRPETFQWLWKPWKLARVFNVFHIQSAIEQFFRYFFYRDPWIKCYNFIFKIDFLRDTFISVFIAFKFRYIFAFDINIFYFHFFFTLKLLDFCAFLLSIYFAFIHFWTGFHLKHFSTFGLLNSQSLLKVFFF